MTRFSVRKAGVRLASHQRGAIVLTFAALLPVLLAMIAVALFFAMYTQAVVRAGQASDAASVTCAFQQGGSTGVLQGYLDYYRPVFVPDALLTSQQLDAKQGCQIAGQYSFKPFIPELLPVSSQEEVHTNSQSHSRLLTSAVGNSADFTLVLDISTSMNKVFPQLKRIVREVLDDFESGNTRVRFSIVPFQTGVSVKDAPWYPASKGRAMCVDDLTYTSRNELMADKAVDDLNLSASQLSMKELPASPWRQQCSVSATILPLTDNFKQLKRYVSALTTENGDTRSYQGLIWGVRTLTPLWQQEWQVQAAHSVRPVQRLVLLTDGADTPFARKEDLGALTRAGLCQVIQQDLGIEMRFIGFDVSQERLAQFRKCAGNTGVVYDARDTEELEADFRAALELETQSRIVLGE